MQRFCGGPGPGRPPLGLRPRHIGHQQHTAHQVFHRLHQGFGWGQGFNLGQQRVGVFQIVRVKVAVQRGQWLQQRGLVLVHQRGEQVHRSGKAGHPGQHGLGRCGRVVQLVDPRVKPQALGDGAVQLAVAAQHQCAQQHRIKPGRWFAALHIGDVGQPARLGNRAGLQQHTAQITVDHHRVQRLQRGGQAVHQGLQRVQLGLGKRAVRRVRRRACLRGVGRGLGQFFGQGAHG